MSVTPVLGPRVESMAMVGGAPFESCLFQATEPFLQGGLQGLTIYIKLIGALFCLEPSALSSVPQDSWEFTFGTQVLDMVALCWHPGQHPRAHRVIGEGVGWLQGTQTPWTGSVRTCVSLAVWSPFGAKGGFCLLS